MVPFEIGYMNAWQTTGALVVLGVVVLIYLLSAGGAIWVTWTSMSAVTRRTTQVVVLGTGMALVFLVFGLLWYWASFKSPFRVETQAWRVGAGIYVTAILVAILSSSMMATILHAPVRRSGVISVAASLGFLAIPFVIVLLEFQTQCVTGTTIWLKGALLCN